VKWVVLVGAIAALTLVGALTLGARTASSVLGNYAIAKGPDARWRLPNTLREVSGLATSADGRVFAHGDERAVILELDAGRQRATKAFAMGPRGVPGDFEGIAIADGRFWLVTSNGVLYESAEGADGAEVTVRTHDTGVGAQCEVEGLAHDPTANTLVMACKEPRVRALRGVVAIFSWSIPRKTVVRTLRMRADLLGRAVGASSFHPSAIERDSTTGHWLLLAARERAVVEITPEGSIVGGVRLPRRDHQQPEGITIASDRSLLIADEGGGRAGTLSVYRRAR